MFSVGILGGYVAHIYDASKGHPCILFLREGKVILCVYKDA